MGWREGRVREREKERWMMGLWWNKPEKIAMATVGLVVGHLVGMSL